MLLVFFKTYFVLIRLVGGKSKLGFCGFYDGFCAFSRFFEMVFILGFVVLSSVLWWFWVFSWSFLDGFLAFSSATWWFGPSSPGLVNFSRFFNLVGYKLGWFSG